MRDFFKEIGDILGSTYAIVPVGRAQNENVAHTTVTTVGGGAGNGLVFTYSEARTSFDQPTDYLRNGHRLPLVPFNGTDEDLDSPDAAFWSRDDAGGANGFSIGARVRLTGTRTEYFMAKWDTDPEWLFRLTAGAPTLILRDTNNVVQSMRRADAAISAGVLHDVFVTYDGAGGATAADTIIVYVDGVEVASTATNNAAYVGMGDNGDKVTVASLAGASILDGILVGGQPGPFFTHKTLSAVEVKRLYQIGLAAQKAAPSLLIPRRRLVKV